MIDDKKRRTGKKGDGKTKKKEERRYAQYTASLRASGRPAILSPFSLCDLHAFSSRVFRCAKKRYALLYDHHTSHFTLVTGDW
mmetsp:Transcript_5703/g.13348  ORF Transcript_5703/g.13348 Transcript_5703/m.13348 type:complete len:83 (-) Transcript_5703:454-702(-)